MVLLLEWELVSQIINEVLANVWIIVDQLGLPNHPVFVSSVSECMAYVAIGVISTWGVLSLLIKGYWENTKWMLLKLPPILKPRW